MADYPDEYLDIEDPTEFSKLDTPSHSQQHIDINAEVLSVETELGLDPAGTSDTVVERLDASDVLVAFNTSHRALTNNPHGVTGAQITGTSLAAAIVTSSLTALGTIASLVATKLTSTPDPITATSEGIAASITTINTEVTTNGDSDLDNVTLANGTSGQIKHIYCVVEGNASDTWKITPATMCGGTQITFAGVGEGCTLVYADNEGWVVVANNGGTIS